MRTVRFRSAPGFNGKKNDRQKNDSQKKKRYADQREKERINLVRHRRALRRKETELIHGKSLLIGTDRWVVRSRTCFVESSARSAIAPYHQGDESDDRQ